MKRRQDMVFASGMLGNPAYEVDVLRTDVPDRVALRVQIDRPEAERLLRRFRLDAGRDASRPLPGDDGAFCDELRLAVEWVAASAPLWGDT